VLPVNNTFVIFELSGADIVAALENGVSRVEASEGNGRFLQVSGLRFTWDGSRAVGRRILSVEVEDAPGDFESLDPDEVYTVVINDYLFAGGDDFAMFAENSSNSYDFGRTLDEIVRTYIGQSSPLSLAAQEGRIKRLDRWYRSPEPDPGG
jgi:5'-nucleotidase